MSKTITRADLADAVWRKVGLSHIESGKIVDSIFAKITESLHNDGMVKISSFGTFVVRNKPQRMGRNPRTGESVMISPRRVLTFKSSVALKEFVATGERQQLSASGNE